MLISGVEVALEERWLDRYDGEHVLLAAGPFLRCAEHHGAVERQGVVEALVALSHARRCHRVATAWQRVMLADDEAFAPGLRTLPRRLLGYHRDQSVQHAARLDAVLDQTTPRRERRRWHTIGWRAAPSIATAYQQAGIEAGLALVALRHGVEPARVHVAASDTRSPVGAALRDGGHRDLKLLNLGVRSRVTDDLPYEPLDADLPSVPAPVITNSWSLADATLLDELSRLSPAEVIERIRSWAEGHGEELPASFVTDR